MNKRELVENIAAKTGLSRAASRRLLDAVTSGISQALAGGQKVSLKGFGSWKTQTRTARPGRNPRSGEKLLLPATRAVRFRPGIRLREVIKETTSPGQVPGEQKIGRKKAHVIAVTSGKGGTGKTNFVINSAIAMAQRGRKVFVIDADLGTANVDILLGLHCRYSINDLISDQSLTLRDIAVEGPEGVLIIPGGSGLQELAELSPAALIRTIEMLKPLEEQADVLIIDTGSGISRNVIEFALAADEIIVVVTPEPHAVSDAYAIIKVLSTRQNTPPLKLVFNQVESYSEARLVAARLVDVAERFLQINPEILGHIVRDDNLVRSVKHFQPIVLYNPLAPAARCLTAIVEKIIPPAGDEESVTRPSSQDSFITRLKDLFARPS